MEVMQYITLFTQLLAFFHDNLPLVNPCLALFFFNNKKGGGVYT